jgi:hypothetical protein
LNIDLPRTWIQQVTRYSGQYCSGSVLRISRV